MTKLKVQENNSQVLSLLQAAVNGETTSRNLYFARAVFWDSIGFHKLAEYYEKQSQEDHCQLSADRMAFLGEQPAFSPSSVQPLTEESIAEQYRIDLQVEVALAENYTESIKTAETLGDYITAQIWRVVLQSTQEHCAYLQQELKKIELVGEQNYLTTWA